MYLYQQADINRLMDSSRPLTALMNRWIEAAESSITDLGYDDWKAEQRRLRKASGTHAAAGKTEMSFDPSEYYIAEGSEPPIAERCNVPACRHADDDELVRCESCGQMSCLGHAQRHSDGDICLGCRGKELRAMSVCCHALGDLTDLMVKGRISGAAAAQKMFEIVKTLEKWDV